MSAGKRRAARPVRVGSYALSFRPKHCAGDTCLHDHARDPRPTIPLVRPDFAYGAERAAETEAKRPVWAVPNLRLPGGAR